MDDAQQMIIDCKKRAHKLNEWEFSFIDGITNHTQFSQKQMEILEKIWDRVTS